MLSNDSGAGDACAGDVSVPCRVCPWVDIFHIDLNEHKRLLAFPRPVGGIEAAALHARTPGCRRVASQGVSDGVGGEVNALLGEASASMHLHSWMGFVRYTLL